MEEARWSRIEKSALVQVICDTLTRAKSVADYRRI